MKINRFLLLAAGLSLAITFTLSCSGGDDNGGGLSSPSNGGDKVWVPCSNAPTSCPNASTTPVNAEGIGSVACGGETYKSVKIGEQVWMAKNLNYNASCSRCYDNDPANCNQYGRLYTREASLKACPDGWHLPSDEEWTVLIDFVGGSSVAGTKLKATSVWASYGNGTDDYGFSALPTGQGWWARIPDYPNGFFGFEGMLTDWWSASETSSTSSHYWGINIGKGMSRYNDGENNIDLLSVRCVKD
jgi:uncharacterized protein (TIGR02145 family)